MECQSYDFQKTDIGRITALTQPFYAVAQQTRRLNYLLPGFKIVKRALDVTNPIGQKTIRLLQIRHTLLKFVVLVFLQRFFKTGPGEYAAGDLFIGINVPVLRSLAKKYQSLSLGEVLHLLKSRIHEERLLSLLILILKYRAGDLVVKKKIYRAYLAHTAYINNWDLVDLSAGYIVGKYLLKRDRKILLKLAQSKNLWERRIAMIATFAFIYEGEFEWTFKIAKILLHDEHDLIQKAVGWMLREVGKRVSQKELEDFLKENAKTMPRTMLRYAIERLPEPKRQYYLKLRAD